jgi:hypothetical protein
MVKRGIVWRRWQRALSGYWNSGLSFAEYCRIHDLKLKAASRWRIRLRPDSSVSESRLEIVHLPMPSPMPPAPELHRAGGSGIKLELGRIGIILDTDFNVEVLQRVLSVLEVR